MKVILYMAMSLNGYIATEDDETPWSDAVWGSYYAIVKQFKVIILGRRTYDIMQEANEFDKIGNPLTIVVTNKKIEIDNKTMIAKSPKDALKICNEMGIDKVFLGGGGQLNASFMKENLIDEVIIDIEPLLFGKGINLFADEDFNTKLELIEINNLSKNTIQLHYKVKK